MEHPHDYKLLNALLRRPPAEVTNAEIEATLRLIHPGCNATVQKKPTRKT